MPDHRILGPDGRPIEREALTQEVAAPSLTGVRSIWSSANIGGLTPARLAAILQNAANGDADAYLTLAEDIEEKDLHYRSVLGTRKLAVTGIELTVEAASEDPADVALGDELREALKAPMWQLDMYDLLDAIGKGFSVVEMIWETSASQWNVKQLHHRDPHWFTFDYYTGQGSGKQLLLLDDGYPQGRPLPPYTFLQHIPKLKTGLPIRQGLARVAAFSWMCKAYSVKDWVQFAEVFGQPLRLGRYGPGAQEQDKQVLRTAVTNLGSDAAAILPESMTIEFIEASKAAGGESFFERLADWLDRQVSKGVLGQTASADSVAGSLGGQDEKEEIRQDILQSDCNQLAATLNRDFVKPYIDLNHGPRDNYPTIVIRVPDKTDIRLIAEVVDRLVPRGLEVDQSVMLDIIGLPDHVPGAKMLTGGPAAPDTDDQDPADPTDPADPADPDQDPPATNRSRCPGCGQVHGPALNRANGNRQPTDTLDQLAEEALSDWQQQMAPIISPLQQLAAQAQDQQAFLDGLPGLLAQMDSGELVRQLAISSYQARGTGDASDDPKV